MLDFNCFSWYWYNMYRCRFLNHGLYIAEYTLQHCHLSVHAPEFRQYNYIMDYDGTQKIDWDYVFNLKKSLAEQMKKGDIPSFCKGCHWIEEYDEKNEAVNNIPENRIGIVWIGNTNKCNCCCTYCNAYEDLKHKKYSNGFNLLPLFKEMLEKKIFVPNEPIYNWFGGSRVSFGYGEPTISPKFNDLIKFFYKNNINDISVFSNGIVFSKPLAECLKSKDIDMNLVISIDSATRETYKRIKEVDKFKNVCDSIKKYVKAASNDKVEKVQIKYIICPSINDTKEEIDKWFDLCVNKLGVRSLSADVEEHWYINHKDAIPQHIIDLCLHIKELAKKYNIPFEYFDRVNMIGIRED